jgi:predicted Zn finger-like uncharacterized protein
MIRGKRRFKCDECKSTFRAMDAEYAASAYSMPVKCPVCGSMHTYPYSILSSVLPSCAAKDYNVYKEIWKQMDEQQ